MFGLWLCWAIPVVLLILFPICFPYLFLRTLVAFLRCTCYHVRLNGIENVPEAGPGLLVVNHVSIFDSLILIGLTNRRIHFMMQSDFYRMPILHQIFFRRIGVLEVPNSGKPKQMIDFLQRTRDLLRAGDLVCVFPEGEVSGNGLIMRFKKGIPRMLPEDVDVPVIPVRLGMIWGSIFSFYSGHVKFICPRQFPIPVSITVGKPVPRDITAFQMRQMISEMGAEAELAAFPQERPIHHAFVRTVKRHPFAIAYKDFGANKAPRNYEMLIRALVFSKIIREIDSGNSHYIGVLLPNTTVLAAVLHGILFADRVPAVMNFTAGKAAREHAIKNANMKVILTSRKFLEKLQIEQTPEMFCLEDLAEKVTPSMKRRAIFHTFFLPTRFLVKLYAPLSWYDLKREAVLLFSSGSTGIPKGIRLTHHNLNSNFFSFWRIINWTPRDRVVGNLPLFHAYGFMVCFVLSAVAGTRVIYLPNPLDAAGVCSLVEKEKPTLMMATPTFLQHYLRKFKPGQFDSLRLVITGAEKLRQDISTQFKELTGLSIVEGFGCTELSPIVTVNLSYSIFTLGRESGMKGSIGAPLPGIHVKIVDPETLVELPYNTSGLMLVKGALVMKGYLNDPEATARAIDKDGYYNTGDIATMSVDGYVTITGRLSRFSKIAGEMVPHELIEMAINEILASEERCVAVCGAPDEKRGEKIMVFYSTNHLNPSEMTERMKERNMPNLWIPKTTDFVFVEKIPMLGSGKLDFQTLQKMARDLVNKPVAA